MKRYRVNHKLLGIAAALSKAENTSVKGAAVPLPEDTLHTLGQQLTAIANGENACHVLNQTKHGAEPKTRRHLDIAYIYWRRFVEGAEKRDAIAAAKKAIPGAKDIYGVAQRYREHFLGTDSTAAPGGELNGRMGILGFDDDITEDQLAAARAHLKAESARSFLIGENCRRSLQPSTTELAIVFTRAPSHRETRRSLQ